MSKIKLFYFFDKQIYKSPWLIFFVAGMLFGGCNAKNPKAGTDIEVYEIDFEQCLHTERQMFLSEIADSITYLELKTPDDIIITNIMDVIPCNDRLLLYHRFGVSLFHKDGRFIRQIGAMGQGPGEYDVANGIAIDTKRKEIIVGSINKLLFYDLEGVFLRSIDHTFYSTEMGGISDSIIWLGDLFAANNEKYKAFAIPANGKFDTLAFIPNENYGMTVSGQQAINMDPLMKFFYPYNGSLYFKGNRYNDMVWRLSGLNPVPYASINMGKYKIPVKYQDWFSEDEFERNRDRYRAVSVVQEDDNYLFLYSHSFMRQESTPTRLRANYADVRYIVFDKKAKKGFTAKDRNGTGLTDDILGGPSFWPRWASDDCYFNAIEASELLAIIDAGEYVPAAPLKDLLSGINENTNQLLIMCRKK